MLIQVSPKNITMNYQDTHRKYVAAYIKKLGLRFSVIVGVLVNIGVLSYLQKILKQH
jgi:hypothetical protein